MDGNWKLIDVDQLAMCSARGRLLEAAMHMLVVVSAGGTSLLICSSPADIN